MVVRGTLEDRSVSSSTSDRRSWMLKVLGENVHHKSFKSKENLRKVSQWFRCYLFICTLFILGLYLSTQRMKYCSIPTFENKQLVVYETTMNRTTLDATLHVYSNTFRLTPMPTTATRTHVLYLPVRAVQGEVPYKLRPHTCYIVR